MRIPTIPSGVDEELQDRDVVQEYRVFGYVYYVTLLKCNTGEMQGFVLVKAGQGDGVWFGDTQQLDIMCQPSLWQTDRCIRNGTKQNETGWGEGGVSKWV